MSVEIGENTIVSLLFACTGTDLGTWADPEIWTEALKSELPDLDIRIWPDYGEADEVEFALVWGDVARELNLFKSLKILFSLGAGVEHLLVDATVLQEVPIVRMVDPALKAGMVEFVLMRILHYHRRMPEYEAQEKQARWMALSQKLAAEQRIGIMGLGALGGAVAEALIPFGFDVAGWSRTPGNIDGITCFDGDDGLIPFLNRSDILICLLPLTRATRNMLDGRLLAELAAGAYLINVARGNHLVDEDLLAALDSGHIAGATLDVFRDEPLPADHPFWSHPKIAVLPHIAAPTHASASAAAIADNIRRFRNGEELWHLVDKARGY